MKTQLDRLIGAEIDESLRVVVDHRFICKFKSDRTKTLFAEVEREESCPRTTRNVEASVVDSEKNCVYDGQLGLHYDEDLECESVTLLMNDDVEQRLIFAVDVEVVHKSK